MKVEKMGFNPGIEVGQVIKNSELMEVFKCANRGGMRRSRATGTLVLITDSSTKLYKDKWRDGVIYYTGTGQVNDQVLKGKQNETLYYSNSNGVEIHLFEVNHSSYEYLGIVKLIDKPYQEIQPDTKGSMRKVWMFPLKAIAPKIEHRDTEEEEKKKQESSKTLIYTYVPDEKQRMLLETNEYCARIGNSIYLKCLDDQVEKKFKIQAVKMLGDMKLPPIPNTCLGREIGYEFSHQGYRYQLTRIEE
jgi:5-methylcytosine-specific restriction protein A